MYYQYIMNKKCAICLRGKCLDVNLNCKDNTINVVNYKNCIQSVFEKIVNQNPDIEFDFYLHGWVNDMSSIEEIVSDYKPKKYILEKQKDFINDFINIANYSDILRERYKHLHKKNQHSYNSIHFHNYFQSIFSYAYSISKVIDLIPEDSNYDYILHLRYDVHIDENIKFNILHDKVYIDNMASSLSPLFYGDFIYLSSKQNEIFMKYFYTFLKNEIFNNDEYKRWVLNIIKNKQPNAIGRYDHGIYSNQMIYAYFITKNNIPYEHIIPELNCRLRL